MWLPPTVHAACSLFKTSIIQRFENRQAFCPWRGLENNPPLASSMSRFLRGASSPYLPDPASSNFPSLSLLLSDSVVAWQFVCAAFARSEPLPASPPASYLLLKHLKSERKEGRSRQTGQTGGTKRKMGGMWHCGMVGRHGTDSAFSFLYVFCLLLPCACHPAFYPTTAPFCLLHLLLPGSSPPMR